MIFCHFLSPPIKSIFNVGFSQSRLSNQFLTLEDGGELSYFLLAILDLGILLRLGHGRGICIVDAFIIIFNIIINFIE